MAPIVESIEIARRPEEVFAYVTQFDKHPDWQPGLVSSTVEGGGPIRAGSRVVEVRRVPGREVAYTGEITRLEPPRTFSFQGLTGPVRPAGTVTIDPVGDGSSSRVTIRLDLRGHGLGVLVAPLARRRARADVPAGHARLKELLESGGA
jgi:uncharacterized protein YndB with AHSA1/START domain